MKTDQTGRMPRLICVFAGCTLVLLVLSYHGSCMHFFFLNWTFPFYRELQIQFHLEAGKLCHMFYMYKEAREHANTAKKLAAINIQFTGKQS